MRTIGGFYIFDKFDLGMREKRERERERERERRGEGRGVTYLSMF